MWALIPPVLFLYEYVKEFPAGTKRPEREEERLKELHELSRNIWLALLVVLAAILGIPWPSA